MHFAFQLRVNARVVRQNVDFGHSDRAREVEPLPDICEDFSHEVYVHRRGGANIPVDFECFNACTSIEPLLWLSPRRPRACFLIIALFFVFVLLSSFLGAFFTVNKQYGYSMGDAFTLAGWVIGVGAFSLMGIAAWHYPRCRCWDRGEGQASEIEFLVQSHG